MTIHLLSVQLLGRTRQADGRDALGSFIRVGSVYYPNTPEGKRKAMEALWYIRYALATKMRKKVKYGRRSLSGYRLS